MDWRPVFEAVAAELARAAPPPSVRAVAAEISIGELIDKITILELKAERIGDPARLRNVRAELGRLRAVHARAVRPSEPVDTLTAELRSVNAALWQVEDDIRLCERAGDFGERFVELSRAVYRTNDLRASIKKRLNELLGSEIVEEKQYA